MGSPHSRPAGPEGLLVSTAKTLETAGGKKRRRADSRSSERPQRAERSDSRGRPGSQRGSGAERGWGRRAAGREWGRGGRAKRRAPGCRKGGLRLRGRAAPRAAAASEAPRPGRCTPHGTTRRRCRQAPATRTHPERREGERRAPRCPAPARPGRRAPLPALPPAGVTRLAARLPRSSGETRKPVRLSPSGSRRGCRAGDRASRDRTRAEVAAARYLTCAGAPGRPSLVREGGAAHARWARPRSAAQGHGEPGPARIGVGIGSRPGAPRGWALPRGEAWTTPAGKSLFLEPPGGSQASASLHWRPRRGAQAAALVSSRRGFRGKLRRVPERRSRVVGAAGAFGGAFPVVVSAGASGAVLRAGSSAGARGAGPPTCASHRAGRCWARFLKAGPCSLLLGAAACLRTPAAG